MNPTAINDELLIKACFGGNTQAFETLVRKYQSWVCAITFSATGSVDKSEEIAQEVFVLAWQNLAQLQNYAKFKNWLYIITKNKIRKFYRDQKNDPITRAAALTTAGHITDDTAPPPEAAISKEQQDFVRDALNRLPEDYREPLVLFYREGQSVKQVAACFELTEVAAKKRISRARQMLKSRLTAALEQTLEQSRPGEKFALGVIGLIAAGGAFSQASAATAAAETAQIGSGLITMFLQSTAAKITAAAAVLLIGAGAVFVAAGRHEQAPPQPVVTLLPKECDAGLVLHLSFDEVMEKGNKTVVIDASPAANNGILTGGKIVDGRIGKALKCSAKNKADGVIIKDSDSLDLDAVTIAAWIKTSRTDAQWGRILDKGWRTAYNICIGGDYEGTTMRKQISFETAQQCTYSKSHITDGKWHLIVGTYDGQTSSIYIDGKLNSRTMLKKPVPMKHTDTDIHIASLAVPEEPPQDEAFFDGLIDEVRLYNRVLTDWQIQTLYRYQPY